MTESQRLGTALMISGLLHVGVLILAAADVPDVAPVAAFRVALVGALGGGGGAGGEVGEAATAPEPPAPEVPQVAPRPAPVARPARRPAPVRPVPEELSAGGEGVASIGPGAGEVGEGTGGRGDGSGGDGSGGARPAYGQNPLPPYPLLARRLRREGVVLLEVAVAADGRPTDVRVVRSSGFAPLDDSASRTVAERWRFIPAHRDGAPVASRVTVPVRFELSGAG